MDSDDSPHPTLTDEDKLVLLRLARQTLIDYLGSGALPDVRTDSAALLQPRATFVTLRSQDTDELRGCRGEVIASQPLIESVAHTAISSATEDPRFMPVTVDEIPFLHIEISALTPMTPIFPEEIIIGRHGLMIQKGPYAGLLLPQVPTTHGWDREEYLDALCHKAGMPAGAWREPGVELLAFEAEVWEESKGSRA
jgi:AmmeMemoRadiSam system protein A